MLLAVEGGGFFSSSASGYTSGLRLLILGRRSEERPTKVSPWNQYQLVDQEVEPDPHLASKKNQPSCGCTSFVCFNCGSAALDGSTHPKVGPNRSDASSASPSLQRDDVTSNGSVGESEKRGQLKSSLKKHLRERSVIVEGDDAHDSLEEAQDTLSCCTERRKVHWTDACGKELAEIREFELSDEHSSDEDFDSGTARRCECVIQ